MKSVNHLVLTPGSLSLAQLREISRHKLTLELAPEAITDINTSAQIVQKVLDEGRTVYRHQHGFWLVGPIPR